MVVHAHFLENSATFALVMARLLDVPYTLTAHAVPDRELPLLRRKLGEARAVAVISLIPCTPFRAFSTLITIPSSTSGAEAPG